MSKSDYDGPDQFIPITDWQDAYQVQDACNLSGVVRSWSIIMGHLWDEARARGMGTEWVNHHPICLMFADKVAQLTGTQFGMPKADERVLDAYDLQREKVALFRKEKL